MENIFPLNRLLTEFILKTPEPDASALSSQAMDPAALIARPDAAAFVSQMRPALVRYFKRKTGNDTEAEDLAQDVIMRALSHVNWENPIQARGYIFRAAANRWNDLRRRSRAHGTVVEWNEETAEESGSESPPESVIIHQEELVQIARVLGGLPSRTRTVVTLIRFEQMKIAVVAEKLGISERAVHRHLAKAMKELGRLKEARDSQL